MVVYSDSFARANGALGASWVYGNGSTNPAIVSDAAGMSNTTAGFYPAAYVDPIQTDAQFVQVTLSGAVTSSGSSFFLRGSSSWSQYVLMGVSTAGTYIQLVTAGPTYTTEVTSSTAIPSGATLLLTALGHTYTAYVNGLQMCQWVDSGAATVIGAGYRLGGVSAYRTGSTNAQSVQDFIFGDIPAPLLLSQSVKRAAFY